MIVDVNVNAASTLLHLRNGGKRLAYATVGALNATALRIQVAQKARVAKVFTLRAKREFILRQAAIIKFANVNAGRFESRVSVGEKPGLLLTTFERGGTRTSRTGQSVAVPLTGGVRPTLKAEIPTDLYVRRLGIRRSGKRAGRGKAGTFLVPKLGILQRVGAAVRVLYAFKRTVPIPRRLEFFKTAHAVAQRWFAQELAIRVRETLLRRRT
jgi:hypothetical protein